MQAFFSPSQNVFLNPLWRGQYESAGTWPADAVEVDDEIFQKFGVDQPPEGKCRGVSPTGSPVWVDLPEPTTEELAVGIRMQRDLLLRESDWTQAADIPDTTKLPWREYRDALRDIPQQEGFPKAVIWPDRP